VARAEAHGVRPLREEPLTEAFPTPSVAGSKAARPTRRSFGSLDRHRELLRSRLYLSGVSPPVPVEDEDGLVADTAAEALERLYRRDGERLWKAVLAYTGDAGVAEDAVAEAFAQALRRGDHLRDPARWVWSVAFRLARGELAMRRRIGGALAEMPYEMPEPAHDLLVALQRLSPKQRACVVLHHLGGYPVKDIATMVDSTLRP
jgi:RNA polymerase sigma-70 factor, ECF subfamily